jgi:hypothetical protein
VPATTICSQACVGLRNATARPSFAVYNRFDAIDVVLRAVRRIAEGGTDAG